MTEHFITLSTTEPNNNIGIVKLRHADVNSQAIVAQIVENGQPKNFEGLQPFFCLMAQEVTGQGVSEESIVSFDASKGTLSYIVSDNALQMVGRNEAYFSFRKQEGGRWIEQFSTRTFHYIVEKSIYSQPFKDSNYWWTFKELNRIFNQYIEDGKKSWEEFVKANREILESIDPGGQVLSELIRSRKPEEANSAYPDLPTRLDKQIGKNTDFRSFESDKSFMTRVYNESAERGLNVKWFGAVGDGKTDDTKAIQAAINFFKNSDFKTLIFEGTFLCSKVASDSDKRGYALIFDALENKNIDLTRAKFITGAVDNIPSLLAFYNCSNINVVGGQAEANTSVLATTTLYSGAFIYANKCTNINIKDTYVKNMCYTACLFNCSTGRIKNNIFTHTQQQANRNLRPYSAIILYNSSHFKVLENDVNGGLQDGDISVFGAGSYFNLVAFNHLRSDGTNWEEAITVDGGAKKTIVSNNIVEGFYNYGIDVKDDAENTLVISNTVEKCVVCITDHGGEINPNGQVFQTVIHDNNIILGDIPSSQGWGDHRQTGIGISNQYAADVKGNHLTLGRKYDVNYPIYGIMVSQPSSPIQDYISQADVSNNFIELKNGIGSDYQIAGNGSTALCLETIVSGNITNNDIKAPNGDLAVKILGKNNVIKFSANHFITDGVAAIQYYGDASCNNLIITDDNYYQVGNLTNAHMYQTTFNNHNQTYILSQKTFGSAKANPFFFITSKWDNNVILHVDMAYDYSGTFIVDSTYKLAINIKDRMTVVPIDEHNSDVELSAVHISENMFGLCAKATRHCPDISNLVFKVTVISSDNSNVFS